MLDTKKETVLEDFGTVMPPLIAMKSGRTHGSSPEEPEETKELVGSGGFSVWSVGGAETFIPSFKTTERLPSGMYTIAGATQDDRVILKRLPINVDELLVFPNSLAEKIANEIENFWKRGSFFKTFGFLHRRGYLFYGPAGSGKSCIVQQVIQDVINRDGIVLLCNAPPKAVDMALLQFRQVEPDRKVVCIFEDIDAIVENYGESNLLALLDGENQINQVLNIATTNYPEKLDKRIVSRPRRFDRVIKINAPDSITRRMYFEKKLNFTNGEVDKWVKATEGFSFAAIAELVISTKCLGNSFESAVENIKSLMIKKISSEDFDRHETGFTPEGV